MAFSLIPPALVRFPLLRVLAAIVALLPLCSVQGELVSITSAPFDKSGSNFAQCGTLVFAWNTNGNVANPPKIKGFTFANEQPGSVKLEGFPSAVHEGTPQHPGRFAKPNYSGGMLDLMEHYVGTAPSVGGTVTLSGLTVGTLYHVQFVHHQDVNDDAQRRMRVIFGAVPKPHNPAMVTPELGIGNDVGYLTTVVFKADSTTQLFTLYPAGGSRAILNAMILQKVDMAIHSPLSGQVIQRNQAHKGDIPISGKFEGNLRRVEARAVLMSGTGNSGTSTEWSTIDDTISNGGFSGILKDVPEGGWYQIEVRPVTVNAPGEPVTIPRVGIGDIYLTAGQSNAANRGSPAYSPKDDRVVAWNYQTKAWSNAADPMPGASAGGGNGSPWSRLGDMLASREKVPVAFVCMAESGSSIDQWLPHAPKNLYSRIEAAVKAFPANGFRAVLFHQGESDALASSSAATYKSRLKSIISQSRKDAGWPVPWYIAEASYLPNSSLAQQLPIVAGQLAVIYEDPLVFAGPVTDDFHLENKLHDGVHFNEQGLSDHAAQWAKVLTGTAPIRPTNPDMESNAALEDGGMCRISTTEANSPTVIGWRILNAANDDVADGTYGYYNPIQAFYNSADDTPTSGGNLPGMSGRHVAFLWNSSENTCFLQTSRAELSADSTYTFTVAVGIHSAATVFGGVALDLLADGKVLASKSFDRAGIDALHGGTAAGTFTDVTLTHSTGQTVAPGQQLSIRIRKLTGGNTYLDFDNVRLTVSKAAR